MIELSSLKAEGFSARMGGDFKGLQEDKRAANEYGDWKVTSVYNR